MRKVSGGVVTIAGFDPSGGAGILADVKTCEALGVYASAVCTAVTVQDDKEFKSLSWMNEKLIQEQLEICLARFLPSVVKIGLVENEPLLKNLITQIRTFDEGITIIWDPVLSSTTGFNFHSGFSIEFIQNYFSEKDLITPNQKEFEILFGEQSIEAFEQTTKLHCSVLLKGGHDSRNPGKDILLSQEKIQELFPEFSLGVVTEKHGSGCVLSSAIGSFIVHGKTIAEACIEAKKYMLEFLSSDEGLLGWHTPQREFQTT